jgi:hypothetical protein
VRGWKKDPSIYKWLLHFEDGPHIMPDFAAGWSSLAARRAHNPKVVGSNPTPATNSQQKTARRYNAGPFFFWGGRLIWYVLISPKHFFVWYGLAVFSLLLALARLFGLCAVVEEREARVFTVFGWAKGRQHEGEREILFQLRRKGC